MQFDISEKQFVHRVSLEETIQGKFDIESLGNKFMSYIIYFKKT